MKWKDKIVFYLMLGLFGVISFLALIGLYFTAFYKKIYEWSDRVI